MDLSTLDKKEKDRFKIAIEKVGNAFPYIRGEEREIVAYQLGISGAMSEADLQAIDTRLVFWPQITSEVVEGELPSKKDITAALKSFNEYRKLTKQPAPEYEFKNVLMAEVKIFKKQLNDVRFLGITLEDGKKIRFLLESKTVVKKKIERKKTHKFATQEDSEPIIA